MADGGLPIALVSGPAPPWATATATTAAVSEERPQNSIIENTVRKAAASSPSPSPEEHQATHLMPAVSPPYTQACASLPRLGRVSPFASSTQAAAAAVAQQAAATGAAHAAAAGTGGDSINSSSSTLAHHGRQQQQQQQVQVGGGASSSSSSSSPSVLVASVRLAPVSGRVLGQTNMSGDVGAASHHQHLSVPGTAAPGGGLLIGEGAETAGIAATSAAAAPAPGGGGGGVEAGGSQGEREGGPSLAELTSAAQAERKDRILEEVAKQQGVLHGLREQHAGKRGRYK